MSDRRTGIDQRGGGLFAVSLRDDDGRVVVDRLEANLGCLNEQLDLVQDSTVGLAIPDQLVMVKRMQLEGSFAGSLTDRLHFELAQSLLESEDEFHFDHLAVQFSITLLNGFHKPLANEIRAICQYFPERCE